MPTASSPPSPPPTHTASTTRRVPLPVAPPIPLAPDGAVNDPELERRWANVKSRLSTVLRDVRNRQPVRTEPEHWVNMYTDVATLYTQDDTLRKRRMYLYVRQFVRDLVATQYQHLQKLTGTELLAEYCITWRASMRFIKFMKRVLHHLHRYWIPEHANTVKEDPVRPLDKLLMFYWREDLLSRLHSVVTIALDLVNEDRRGVTIDHSIVRGVVDTLVEIGAADIPAPNHEPLSPNSISEATPTSQTLHLYVTVFEDDFLSLTRTFYKAEGERMVAVGDVTKFMKNVLTRLEEESERGKRLLHPDSGPRLRQATEEQLIGNHKEYLQREATEMIKAGREEDLKLLYALLNRVENGLNPLRTFFVGYVRAEGNSVVVDHIDKMAGKDDMRSNLGLVRVLITLYRKHASLIKRCFNGSQVIMLGIDDAFRGFANRSLGSLSLPNLIAHYVDHLLRLGPSFDRDMWYIPENEKKAESNSQGNAIVNDSAVPSANASDITLPPSKRPRMQQASVVFNHDKNVAEKGESNADDEDGLSRYMTELVRLFMYLDDKDLFFETHRRLFAKRLLSNHDEDMEMRFIAKVKVQMGPTYTQRLSGMLKDKVVSNTMRTQFIQFLDKKRKDFRLSATKPNATQSVTEHGNVGKLHLQANIIAEKGEINCVTDKAGSEAAIDNVTPPAEQRDTERSEPRRGLSISALVEGPRVSGWHRNSSQHNVNGPNQKDKAEEQKKENDRKIATPSTAELGEALRVDFNAHVLNALHWPAVKVADLRVPSVLKTCQLLFSEFYMKDKETRKLSWIHTMSTVHLGAALGGRKYSLVVSTFQACALLLLSEQDQISVGEACKELNISRSELHQHLNPLMVGSKCKILRLEKRTTSNNEKNGEGTSLKRSTSKRSNDTEKEESKEEAPSREGNPHQANGAANVTVTEGQDSRDPIQFLANGQSDDAKPVTEENLKTSPTDEVSAGTVPVPKRPRADLESTNKDSQNKQVSWEMDDETEIVKVPKEDNNNEKQKNAGENVTDSATTGSGNEDGDGLADSDVIHLNTNYRSKMYRIVVPASVAKLASADAAVSKRNIVVDRSTQVDATLVRIMKASKEITHGALTAQVIAALAPMFIPDPRLIKVRLERLIDQEYVERDAEDARLYRYSA